MNGEPVLSCHHLADNGRPEAVSRAAGRVRYHLHINCFSERLPASVAALQAAGMVSVRRFDTKGSAGDKPLWIATKKLETPDEADQRFAEIAGALARDRTMRGYVEEEAVHARNILRYKLRDYQSAEPFPSLSFRPLEGPRKADIHAFRSAKQPRDVLDTRLAEAGFYEVADATQRIWTLLIGDDTQAAAAFDTLHRHFDRCGGVFKLELEFVRALLPFPANFALQPVYSIA